MPGCDASKDVGSIGKRRTWVLSFKKSAYQLSQESRMQIQSYFECQSVDTEGFYFVFEPENLVLLKGL
jgi:hypothetical protein